MRLGRYLTSLTKPELEELKANLNLTESQLEIFDLLLKGSSREMIADKTSTSPATVGNRIGEIVKKIERLKEMGVI
jgi:DNA-binding NarL/FixJ family response regulator